MPSVGPADLSILHLVSSLASPHVFVFGLSEMYWNPLSIDRYSRSLYCDGLLNIFTVILMRSFKGMKVSSVLSWLEALLVLITLGFVDRSGFQLHSLVHFYATSSLLTVALLLCGRLEKHWEEWAKQFIFLGPRSLTFKSFVQLMSLWYVCGFVLSAQETKMNFS